jgi:hypothetical protein
MIREGATPAIHHDLLSPLVVSDEKEPTGSLEPAETSMNTGNPERVDLGWRIGSGRQDLENGGVDLLLCIEDDKGRS